MDNRDEKIKAAYALNLCTVSVSQILDYNDLNVMEQEYEAILNNLNLENMPHDEALLEILKQLLDTITFFRIDAGDKKMIERQYKDKMKNAIWDAVPNLGLLVAGGNPITVAISLASQIGIGYMNYRKSKASNQLDYDMQMWRLQRTAIEQINALQRELFDTAWRLADTYGFEDELRLTERQIKHYDDILMDSNILRRYDRLESIKDNFVAYPPFWYQLGSTANEIWRNESLSISDDTRQYYREKAKEYFKQYWDSNKYPLLREDQLASSCALEYADLLIEDDAERDTIIELLDKSVKYAGNAWDVLQLAAIGYMRIDAKDKAIPALRVLVNENYNSSVNAQLLSGIYINDYVNNKNIIAQSMYESLALRVNNNALLIPWPTDNSDPKQEFLENQREMLTRRYKHMLNEFREKYAILLNRLIMIPEEEMQRAGADYTDEHLDERVNAVENTLASIMKTEFIRGLDDESYGIKLVNTLNRMFSSLSSISLLKNIDEPVKILETKVGSESGKIEEIQNRIKEYNFKVDDYRTLQNTFSYDFLKDAFDNIRDQIEESIYSLDDMLQFSSASSEMVSFCQNEGIAIPDSKEDRIKDAVTVNRKPQYLSYKVLGDKVVIASRVHAQKEEMSEVIKNKIGDALQSSSNISLAYPGTKAFNVYFDRASTAVKEYKPEVLAVLDDKSFIFNTDLLFMANGIVIVERNGLKEICSYNSVDINKNADKLMIGSTSYHHSSVDIRALHAAIVELKQLSQKR